MALDACIPYYFPQKSLSLGRELCKNLTVAFEPAVWWEQKVIEISYNAAWIPPNVKTLIIGGEFDAMTPFSLFEQDERFDKPNIQKVLIKNAGHLPWIEEPEKVKTLIKVFEEAI